MLAEIKLKFLKWNHFILRRRALHDLIVKHRLPWWTFTQDTFPGRRKTHVQHKMCSGGVLFPSEKTLPQYSCKSFVSHVTSPSAKWVEWFIKVEHVLLVGNTHCKPPSKKKDLSQDTCSRNHSKLSDFSQQLLFNQLFTLRTASCQPDRHMPNSTPPAPGISWFPQHVTIHGWKWTVKGEMQQNL